MVALIALIVVLLFALFVAAQTIRIIPQARAGVVERFGRYSRTLEPGLAIVVPFIDRVKPLIDLREQVVSFPPSGVITEDNVTVNIDTVLYFTITDPKAASYEVASPLQAIEQLTVTTLRNVIGGLTLEDSLTSRDQINSQLRTVLDEATGKWGIRINRVELKAVDPPAGIQEAMEKQMRAERDRRAAILNAEGFKQSQILTAEGEKQSAVLRAEGQKTAAILQAEGEAQAIIESAKAEAERIAAEAKTKMEEFVVRRTKMAETKIAQAEAQALADVRAPAADAAVAAAEMILTETVKGKVADDLLNKGIEDLKTKLN